MALKDTWVDKRNGEDINSADDINQVANAVIEIEKTLENNGESGDDGENGATFTPSVSTDGILSWTNDKGLENPPSVNIKGADGEKGDKGDTGAQGPKGETGPAVALDPTLSLSGKAADAKATGNAVGKLKEDLADLAPVGARVGQLFRVAAIKDDGKYTMEPVDIPTYNDKYRLLASVTLEEDANKVIVNVDSLGNAFACKSIIVTGIPIFNGGGNLKVSVLSKNGSNANEGYNVNVEGGFLGAMAKSGNEIIFGVSENFVINESGKTPMEFFGSASTMYGNKMFRTIKKMGKYFGGGIKLISFDKSGGALLSGSKFEFYGIDME